MAHPHEITAAILNAVRVVRPELGIDRLQPEMHLVQDFGLDGRRLQYLGELIEEALGVILPGSTRLDLLIQGATVMRLHQEIEAAAWAAARAPITNRMLMEARRG
jgi:hypothetical protein